MSRPPDNESPFKKDEPVSRSRKWILLLLFSVLLMIIFRIVYWYDNPSFLLQVQDMTGVLDLGRAVDLFDVGDVGRFLSMMQAGVVGIGLSIVLIWQLKRVARYTKHCQQNRN